MKPIFAYFVLCSVVVLGMTSCNDNYTDEQFRQEISFKSNPNSLGVVDTYIRYKPEGKVTYELPLIVSGSTANSKARTVHVALDTDTLADLNIRKFGGRPELYFKCLPQKYYSFPETIIIPAGESTAVLPISFSLGDLDQSEKWVLPISILDDKAYDYEANPRKYYRKAILRIMPFNDFSGNYSGTMLLSTIMDDPSQHASRSDQRAFVVNDSTIFFYAGLRDIDYLDRRDYKIFFKFTKEKEHLNRYYVDVYTDNPLIHLKVNKRPVYSVSKDMDEVKTYLQHTIISIENIDYEFTDYTTIANYPLKYQITGSLTLQRDLNTLIPDQDQGIQW